MTIGEFERQLRGRFEVREETFRHGDLFLDLIMPRAADELLDEKEFERDERLPYWADLWPSARAMARWLLDQPLEAVNTPGVELGCGIGLASLVLRDRGVDVLATDYYADALLFTRANAQRNGIADPRTALLDWRAVPPDFGRFELVFAADVLYERRSIDLLCPVLRRLVGPRGRAVVADPGRAHLDAFIRRMRDEGWTMHELGVIKEPQPHVQRTSRVQLIQFTRGEA